MITKFYTCFILVLVIASYPNLFAQNQANAKPKISFTFDDGQTKDFGKFKLENWNQMILDNLRKHNLKAILFSTGDNKLSEKGKYVLDSWNNSGHLIANHTFSHPNFNYKNTSLEDFECELIQNDSIIKQYSNYYKYFRFPYLKEGNTYEKVDGFREFMEKMDYKNGHVTIDASDWYIDSRLIKRLNDDSDSDISGYREYYKNHLLNRALFYDSLAFQLTGRKINHVLLLHHNLAAALFLDDLIQHFLDNGWEVINADTAYQDLIYNELTTTLPAGESLIWSMARQSGKFENILRYPAEDGEYEKPNMDKLGL